LVTGFGSGAYSAKLLNGTRHRFSGLSQPHQCGEGVFRMLVTSGPPNFGGGGIPHRIIIISRKPSSKRTTGAGQSGNTPGICGKFPTYLLVTRNSAAIAAWFVVIE
jgi:hypothetical protein